MLLWIIVFVIYFLLSQNNGTVNLMSSTGCKWRFFELLCLLFTSYFNKPRNVKFDIINRKLVAIVYFLVCISYFLLSQYNGLVNFMSSTVFRCKLGFFELLCLFLTCFIHKTMKRWIWCHQQPLDVSGASLNCCVCYLPPSFAKQWNNEFDVINSL